MGAFGAGCGGDDDDGAGGNGGGKTGSKLSAAAVAGGACQMMGDDTECKGIDEYSACLQDKCAAEYKQCLGAGYLKGDFSGGKCETYLSCVTGEDDSCHNDCTRDAECTNCMVGMIATCTLGAGCTAPTCTTKSSGNAGKGSTTNGSGGSSGGGTAGISGTGNKTCKDLESCCNSLPASQKEPCLQAYNAVKGVGDAGCSGVYATFSALGCK
jgi:hypothetical protein